ncbi:MAG: hypothetical protein P4L90_25890 [Rhodopila sp.]|nr:hypothetical protein [Rhodopila sp.]
MHDTKSNNTVRRGPNFAHATVMRSNEQKGAEVERLIAENARLRERVVELEAELDVLKNTGGYGL